MNTHDWQDLLLFSNSERRGVYVLILLCLASAAYNQFVPSIISKREISKFRQEHLSLLSGLNDNYTDNSGKDTIGRNGMFNCESTRDTLTKINTMSPEKKVHDKLPAPGKTITGEETMIKLAIVELRINTASAREMISSGLLRPEHAYRIVKLRNLLGAYHSAEQLRSIFGMTDSIYMDIERFVIVEDVSFRVIKINSLSAEELNAHPYISGGLARQIVNFREKVKKFDSEEDLRKLYFMDEDLLFRILPYVEF